MDTQVVARSAQMIIREAPLLGQYTFREDFSVVSSPSNQLNFNGVCGVLLPSNSQRGDF